jgi:hypothetical protein
MDANPDLTDKVRDICHKNYKSNCGGCEIRKECVARIGPGSVGLDKWIKELNERGEQVGR